MTYDARQVVYNKITYLNIKIKLSKIKYRLILWQFKEYSYKCDSNLWINNFFFWYNIKWYDVEESVETTVRLVMSCKNGDDILTK